MIIKYKGKLTLSPISDKEKVILFKILNPEVANEGEHWQFTVIKEYPLNTTDKNGKRLFIREIMLTQPKKVLFFVVKNGVGHYWNCMTNERIPAKFHIQIKQVQKKFGMTATYVEYNAKPTEQIEKQLMSTFSYEWILEGKNNLEEMAKMLKLNDDEYEEAKEVIDKNAVKIYENLDDEGTSLRYLYKGEDPIPEGTPRHIGWKLQGDKEIWGKYFISRSTDRIKTAIMSGLGYGDRNCPFPLYEEELEQIFKNSVRTFSYTKEGVSTKFYIIRNL